MVETKRKYQYIVKDYLTTDEYHTIEAYTKAIERVVAELRENPEKFIQKTGRFKIEMELVKVNMGKEEQVQ